jgi:hypothetical protein
MENTAVLYLNLAVVEGEAEERGGRAGVQQSRASHAPLHDLLGPGACAVVESHAQPLPPAHGCASTGLIAPRCITSGAALQQNHHHDHHPHHPHCYFCPCTFPARAKGGQVKRWRCRGASSPSSPSPSLGTFNPVHMINSLLAAACGLI